MGDHMRFGRLKFISNCARLTHAFEFGAIISFYYCFVPCCLDCGVGAFQSCVY